MTERRDPEGLPFKNLPYGAWVSRLAAWSCSGGVYHPRLVGGDRSGRDKPRPYNNSQNVVRGFSLAPDWGLQIVIWDLSM